MPNELTLTLFTLSEGQGIAAVGTLKLFSAKGTQIFLVSYVAVMTSVHAYFLG